MAISTTNNCRADTVAVGADDLEMHVPFDPEATLVEVPALNGYPHLLIFPCAILVVAVLSFILLGDALRDALDPKIR